MKKHHILLIILGIVIVGLGIAASLRKSQSVQAATPKVGKEQIVFALKNSGADEEKAGFVAGKQGKVKRLNKAQSRSSNFFSIEYEEKDLGKVLNKLKSDPEVEYAQWNYLYQPDYIPNDARYSDQWSHTKAQASLAWDLTRGDVSIVVAVIGTGVKWDHEDLLNNIWINSDEIPGNGIDDDLNGFLDDEKGWNFENSNPDSRDLDGHETSVAGVVAAEGNNALGISGICPLCKIMPLKVSYTSADVADAIYYAADNGAKIINMSFGSYDPLKYGPDSAVDQAIAYAMARNVLSIATSGNNSISDKRFPGAHESVVGVSATDSNDNRAGFSNWGDWVDVAAPGASILSTTLTGYAYVSGTSFAAPYVAGVAALLYAHYPNLSLAEVKRNLEYNSSKISTDYFIGSGRVNVYKSVSKLRPDLYAVIKRPANNLTMPSSGALEIWGSALGESYQLAYQAENSTDWIQIGSGGETLNGILGYLNIDVLPSNSLFYSIRLLSSFSGLTDTSIIKVYRADSYLPGWPVATNNAVLSAGNVADVDNNGDLELVIGNNSGNVYVINHDGTIMSGWPQVVPAPYVYGSPAIGDIDGDGDLEIVAASYGSATTGGNVKAWQHTGMAVGGWPIPTGQIRGEVVLVNLDADPALEIVAAASGGGVFGKVHAWNGDGSVVSGWPYILPESNVQTAPAVGDVNADGNIDVVVCSWTYCSIIRKDGTLLKQWAESGTHIDPVLADTDGNGTLEIITGEGNSIVVRSYTGALVRSFAMSSSGYGQIAVGDVNNDGSPDIFANAEATPYKVYGWNSNGTVFPGFPKDFTVVAGNPTLGDVNGDGSIDILVTSRDGLVYVWDQTGAILSGFPKATGSQLYTSAVITDLDKDGDVEVITGAVNRLVYAWNLSGAYNAEKMRWPFTRYDNNNTAKVYTPIPADAMPPTVTITSPQNNSAVTGMVTITASASDNVAVSNVEFYVDDVLLIKDDVDPYSVVWDTSSLAPGSTYQIVAKARDGAGNLAVSSPVSISIRETVAPSVTITFPANNASVARNSTVMIAANASDNIAVSKVEFYVNNKLKCTDSAAVYQCSWKVPSKSNAVYTVMAKAYDPGGNTATHTIQVTAK